MIKNRVYCDFVAVDYIQHASRGAGFHHQLSKTQRHTGIFFGRLQYKGAPGGEGNAEHPHGNHGRKVKRCYTGHHADRLAHTVDINTGSCALGVFAFAEMGHAAGKLNDIQATLNVAVGVGYYFAVFFSDQGRQLISIGFDQCFEVEQYARSALWVHAAPRA